MPMLENPNVEISIVICTRNRGGKVVATLDSVLRHQLDKVEVILVDQSTNEETQKVITPYLANSRIRYIHSEEKGSARARNIGLREALGEIVLYTDDDCVVSPNWIATMSECLNNYPKVSMVFSEVIPAPHDESAGFIPTYTPRRDKIVRTMWDKTTSRGIGASMAVRRSAALEIGGFDDLLGPGGEFPDCDEGDLAVRSLLNGWWIYETNKTYIIHDGFRNWEEGKALNKRNWIGIGAAYSKPLRCGHWDFLIVIIFEAFVIALLKPLSKIFRFKRHRGMWSAYYFWRGFFDGLKVPVDRKTIRYFTKSNGIGTQVSAMGGPSKEDIPK